jgi:hypothetical protein
VDQVAARLSISKSLVRNIQKADKAEKDRKPNG